MRSGDLGRRAGFACRLWTIEATASTMPATASGGRPRRSRTRTDRHPAWAAARQDPARAGLQLPYRGPDRIAAGIVAANCRVGGKPGAACHMPQAASSAPTAGAGVKPPGHGTGHAQTGMCRRGQISRFQASMSLKAPLYSVRKRGRTLTAKVARASTRPVAVLTALRFVPIGMSTARVLYGTGAGSAGPASHTGDLAALESAIYGYKKEIYCEVGPYDLYCVGDAVVPLFSSP